MPYRLIVLLLVCIAGGACAGPGGDPGGDPDTSLSAFLSDVRAARFADYAGRDGVAVRDEAAFEEMRDYLLRRYQSADAVGSVTDPGGAVFDCLRGTQSPASPPTPHQPPSVPPRQSNAESTAGCPAGSVPVRRVTLDELVRFPTLADFLGKGPAGGGLPPASTG